MILIQPKIFILLLIVVFCSACNKNQNDFQRLEKLDSLIQTSSAIVADSLQALKPQELSSYNHAYYQLLKIIVNEKEKIKPTDDSQIQWIIKELAINPKSYNYARALFYQGVFNYRNKSYDSTTVIPLRQSIDLLLATNHKYDNRVYLAYYHLGLVHEKYNNTALAFHYFNQSLQLAKQLRDSVMMSGIYPELCWNRMIAKDFENAGHYIDTINRISYLGSKYEEYKENTCAVFYIRTGQYEKALESNRRILSLDLKEPNNQKDLLVDYYNLSDNYLKLQLTDSALFFALKSLQQINDTTNALNYKYYLNTAEIEAKLNLWKASANSYKNSLNALKQSMSNFTNTQLMEVERKYDKSQAENRSQELQFQNRILYLSVALILLVLFILFLVYRQYRISRESQIKMLEQEKVHVEQLILRGNSEKKLMLDLLEYVSNRYVDSQKNLDQLASRMIMNFPDLHFQLKKEFDKVNKEIHSINNKFIHNEVFSHFTHIEDGADELTESEKLFLVLLACNANSKQIALILGTNNASLRVRKHSLKEKLIKMNIKLTDELSKQLNIPKLTNSER